jgi:tetratricopeptide (TPR) repeat protein
MEEINAYISQIKLSITNSDEPEYYNSYMLGQLCLSQGQYVEAVKYLTSASEQIRSLMYNKSINQSFSNGSKKHAESQPIAQADDETAENSNQPIDTSPYAHLHAAIGLSLANTHDYLGNYNIEEDYFMRILKDDPSGIHIGDYAVFLHRRKREYDKAHR